MNIEPDPIDKDKARMRLFRAEVHYLTANDWILYVPGHKDPVTEVWKCWADKDDPRNIISQEEAIDIQKRRDLEKDKQYANHGRSSSSDR